MNSEIIKAVEVLKKGGSILYPTETIWGLGCDATNSNAVNKIYELKQRPANKSMILLVNSLGMIEQYVEAVPEIAWQIVELSDKPITIIYPKGKNIAEGVCAEDGSVAIRLTNNKLCLSLIERLKRPLVSTSANLSGHEFPLKHSDINQSIIDGVDFAFSSINDNQSSGVPSPIIKVGLSGEVKIIRH